MPVFSPISDQARLAALLEVSQVLGTSLNLDDALQTVMDAAIRLTGAERGFLMLFDENSQELVFRIARNTKQESLEAKLFEVSHSVVGEVAKTGTPVVTTNAQDDPRFASQESVVLYALRSIMAVPLTARGQIIGVLYVDNKAKNALFEQRDLELLTTFAGQAAVAIENARLYTRTDRALTARVAELETMQAIDRQLNTTLDFHLVMSTTLEWTVKGTQAAGGWIGLLENTDPDVPPCVRVIAERGTEAKAETYPLDHPRLGRAIDTGETCFPETAPGEGVVMTVPVVREGKVIAVILLEKTGGVFSAEARAFAARVTDHAAIAIENARLYQAIKRANESKSKFVSIVSHELKIPMTSIKGYADLLRREMVGPLNEQQAQFLNIIRSNVERMAVLVNDLADISRIESGRIKLEFASLEISPVVHEALTGLKAQIDAKTQTLTLDLPADLPKVHSDKARLIEVLTNLVSNAHKYSPAGGQIVISAAVEEAQPSPNGSAARPANVRVNVADSGVGISLEDQAKLFAQFFRSDNASVREQPGWGLGLHITKRLVELMGGEISVHSDGVPGKGTTFSFTMPVDA